MKYPLLLATMMLAACGGDPAPTQAGSDPQLPDRERGLLPAMGIANPTPWGNQRPVVPQGYTISAIATDLKIPRQILVLPNGDLLVAEGKGGSAPRLTPKDFIAGYFKSKGTSSVKGGDRLTLLRDADGDGRYGAHDLRQGPERALWPRARQRPDLCRQPGFARAVRLFRRPDAGKRPAGQRHRPAFGDQPSLDQGARRQP